MLKALTVIYLCWTPQNSLDLAKDHPGWIKESEVVDTKIYMGRLIETWSIDEKKLVVVYMHPTQGNRDLWCYIGEVHDQD